MTDNSKTRQMSKIDMVQQITVPIILLYLLQYYVHVQLFTVSTRILCPRFILIYTCTTHVNLVNMLLSYHVLHYVSLYYLILVKLIFCSFDVKQQSIYSITFTWSLNGPWKSFCFCFNQYQDVCRCSTLIYIEHYEQMVKKKNLSEIYKQMEYLSVH
jgi:hypothetical protein